MVGYLASFRIETLKNPGFFSGYAETFMTHNTLPVHGHIQEFIRGTGFCSCFQFYTDVNHHKKCTE